MAIARTADERKLEDSNLVATATASTAPEEAPSIKNRVARVGCNAPPTRTVPVEAPSQGGNRVARAGCDAIPEQVLLQEGEKKRPRPSRRKTLPRLRSGWSTWPRRHSRVPLQARRLSSTREGIPRERERAHQRVRMGRNPCTKSSSRRPNQVRQHMRPGSMPFGASRISLLLCPHQRESRLMRKTSRRIRGAPQRWRGDRSRERRRVWGERGGRGATEEEPTWLAGGRRAGSAG